MPTDISIRNQHNSRTLKEGEFVSNSFSPLLLTMQTFPICNVSIQTIYYSKLGKRKKERIKRTVQRETSEQ